MVTDQQGRRLARFTFTKETTIETRIQTGYADAREAINSAYTMMSSVQHLPAVQQATGCFAFFAAMCARLGIRPDVALDRGQQYLRDGDIAREVSALNEYIDKEISV